MTDRHILKRKCISSKKPDTASNLTELMRVIRKRQRLTQTQVATFLQIEQSAYCRMEADGQGITAEQWFNFCTLTETSPDSAFFGVVDLFSPL